MSYRVSKKIGKVYILFLIAGTVGFVWWLMPSPKETAGQSVPRKESAKVAAQDTAVSSPAGREDAQDTLPAAVINMFKGRSEKEIAGLTAKDLGDESLSLTIRRKLAWSLAKNARPEDMAAIYAYLTSSATDLRVKAVIVEALGYSADPRARDWLISALDCGDNRIIRAALRGLAEMNDPRNQQIFANLLSSLDVPPDVREAAAVALGRLSTPESGQCLMRAWTGGDEAMRAIILQGLAQRDMSETADFFGRIMKDSSDPELRHAVVESAAQAKGNTTPFLLGCLNDPDSSVRAEAAWGLSLQENGGCSGTLMKVLATEEDDQAKGRIYEALGAQPDMNAKAVLARAQTEQDDSVRLAAYGAVIEHFEELSSADQETAGSELSEDLKWLAVNGESLEVRLKAVTGLRKIPIKNKEKVLQAVVSESKDPRVIQATSIDLGNLLK